MLPKKLPCIAVLLFFYLLAPAQIPITGNLQLGDTTQIHILHTVDGDRLLGRVTAIDQEQVTFLFKNRNLLVFKTAEITEIEVQVQVAGPSEPVSDAWFLRTKKGEEYVGRILFCDRLSLEIEVDSLQSEYLPWSKIDSFGLTSPIPSGPFENRSEFHVLKTKRGDRFIGQLISYNGFALHFLLRNGNGLFIPVSDIKNIVWLKTDQIMELEGPRRTIPGPDKLFFTPTAFLLKKREKEFRNSLIGHNSFDYGLSDHVNIGVGFSSVLLASMVTVKLKAGYSLSKYVHVAVGGQIGASYAIDEQTVGILIGYGAISVGTPETHVNFGIGKGSFTDSYSASTTGLTVGTSIRVSDWGRLFVEYIRFYSDGEVEIPFLQLGASWFKKSNRFDFGFAITDLGDDTAVPFPIIGYTKMF
ncbi:MAG: hypothetical protein HY842_02980 [Bacteroidetes bacterium]|nr:hypothetical protein [Bacteroidota bacterium]